MITFFIPMIVASVWSLDINDVRQRRMAQAIIIIVYSLLGAGYP